MATPGVQSAPFATSQPGLFGMLSHLPWMGRPNEGGGELVGPPNPSEAGVSLTYKIRVTSFASPSLPVSSPISHMPPIGDPAGVELPSHEPHGSTCPRRPPHMMITSGSTPSLAQ